MSVASRHEIKIEPLVDRSSAGAEVPVFFLITTADKVLFRCDTEAEARRVKLVMSLIPKMASDIYEPARRPST